MLFLDAPDAAQLGAPPHSTTVSSWLQYWRSCRRLGRTRGVRCGQRASPWGSLRESKNLTGSGGSSARGPRAMLPASATATNVRRLRRFTGAHPIPAW